MITTHRNSYIFQQDWTGKGERGFRDYLLIPAIFFGAVSPGLFISAAVFDFTIGIWTALIMNFIGYGITHLLYLGRMERFWRAMTNWRSSWISRGFLFNALFSFFGFLYALSILPGLAVAISPSIIMTLKIAAIISAILFTGYPGFMLQTVKAIPFWHSLLEPVLFFLQGILGGLAVHVLMLNVMNIASPIIPFLIKLDVVILQVVLILFAITMVVKAKHGGVEKASVEFLVSGDFSRVFLIGTVVVGLVIPLLIVLAAILFSTSFAELRFLNSIAMLMELTGIYLGKYSILRAGIYSPLRK